jgi:hypothetical protein
LLVLAFGDAQVVAVSFGPHAQQYLAVTGVAAGEESFLGAFDRVALDLLDHIANYSGRGKKLASR